MTKSLIYPFVGELLNPLLKPHSKCLEIGCGAKQYRSVLSCEYSGLDLPDSPYLIETPDFACGMEQIPAPDESFDIIFAVGVFICIPDIHGALKQTHRVLRKNGRLVIFDYQKLVGERLRMADSGHHNVWDFNDLSSLLICEGFQKNQIWDRSHELSFPESSIKTIARKLLGIPSQNQNWLVVEAVK
jgi:SAM-dependent methyltransferase